MEEQQETRITTGRQEHPACSRSDLDRNLLGLIDYLGLVRKTSLEGAGNRYNVHIALSTAAIAGVLLVLSERFHSRTEQLNIAIFIGVAYVVVSLLTFRRLVEFTATQKRLKGQIDSLINELQLPADVHETLQSRNASGRTKIGRVASLKGTVGATAILGAAATGVGIGDHFSHDIARVSIAIGCAIFCLGALVLVDEAS